MKTTFALRFLIATRLIRLADWMVGYRPQPQDETTERLLRALGEITALVPFDHPACRVAVEALGDHGVHYRG